MANIAIIGGTGLTTIHNLEIVRREVMQTPYGEPLGPLTHGRLFNTEVVFLARHGYGQNIPPHKVNYRANIWALRNVGVKKVIAINAVGGIHADMRPKSLVIPDQLIDYTWSRLTTYFEEGLSQVVHIDFTHPYSEVLRQVLINAGQEAAQLEIVEYGTYGAMQGPRLETAAEINRMEQDHCHIVGMTGMPEAALDRELELDYACIAVVANWAAGRSTADITMEMIEHNLSEGMVKVRTLLEKTITVL